ncbi:MAG: nitrilase family protein [Bacteroidales bacterium]|jgi:predicted amidohydrolase|nr:nitrilase family protein [Bacteroidales bacterium]
MKVAIFQANTVDNEIDSNLKRYDSYLNQLDSDTDLIVFPEMFTTGFSIDIDHAQTMQQSGLKWMRTKAVERNIAISGTLLIEENKDYVNRHFFVFPNGEFEYYDKKHLFCLSKEPKVITPGNEKKIVNYKGWNIALFTCYDIRFPSWCRNTYKEGKYGYDISIYCASWESSRNFAWENLLVGRAIENVSYVVGVNRVGYDKTNLNYLGCSKILNFKGEKLVDTELNKEEIAYHTLDKQSLESFRKSFPVGEDWD